MGKLVELNIEYIYATIPSKYVVTYQSILMMFAELGEDMLKDCKASCKDRNSNILECFNMFNAAIAAYNLGKLKLADTIIKYINAKIEKLGIHLNDNFILNIDKNGHIKTVVNFDKETQDLKFYIDEDNLNLYFEYIEGLESNMELKNGHLIEYERDN